ncbi:cation transporter [Aliidiomarina taiwanensis]|uniref:Cation transporter n=1 Tax=Aliidiomarina taiwanensis TaxID=946228 RepID=A0A432X8Q8_9GAMM|nr:cation diffusion facilitator family transporter [Aliidiomarina taiwanensis]RUO43749.1 cation transporter [Aliidiomarina taiwanensis]
MHDHTEGQSSKNIAVAFWLNFCFTIIEFMGAALTNSTAIMADAVHDLGDTISLGIGWVLQKISGKPATKKFTYGYKRLSLVGAFVNAVVLLVGSTWVLFEAIPRLWAPQMPMAEGMAVLAIFGVLVNGYAAYRLSHGHTMNEKVLNWHLLEDVLGWVAVLVVAIVLLFVDWPILDPLLSIGFTLFILWNVLKHFRATLRLFVQASPDTQLYQQVNSTLRGMAQVQEVHHMHLWSLDGEAHVLTAHVVLKQPLDAQASVELKEKIADALAAFHLEHTTIEFEWPAEDCRDS